MLGICKSYSFSDSLYVCWFSLKNAGQNVVKGLKTVTLVGEDGKI